MEFIAGPNFSGRSAALMARLREKAPAFFIGPHAEAALSGLSSIVADEIEIYRAPKPGREVFAPLDFAGYAERKPPTLSGGEQVLLALLADNRLGPSGLTVHELTNASSEFACDLATAARPPACEPMTIRVRDLSF